jgi:hypothetical protein
VRNADGKRLMSVPLSHAPWVPWLTVKLLGSEGGGGGEEKGGVGRKPDNGGGGEEGKKRGERLGHALVSLTGVQGGW